MRSRETVGWNGGNDDYADAHAEVGCSSYEREAAENQ